MKALILNSGTGSRMGAITPCKCLVEVDAGVTILDAQIEALLNCGINDLYITTGHNADVLKSYIGEHYPENQITLIYNPLFDQTNYIYSIHLARSHVDDDDILLLHGDLIFEQNVLHDLLAADKSVMVIDTTQPLPEKDFKAVVNNGRVKSVSVNLLTDSVYAQPMYKLLQHDWNLWLGEIEKFCSTGNINVYAENALNEISTSLMLYPLDIKGRKCFEIDNPEDLAYGVEAYQQMPDRLQTTCFRYSSFDKIHEFLCKNSVIKPLIIYDNNLTYLINKLVFNKVTFNSFTPNPDISDVEKAIALFEKEKCDFIISIGGGSAIDVAKGVKMLDFSDSGSAGRLRDTPRAASLAIPTTAGTGSEATCFTVLYKDGEKLSIEHSRFLPEYVILDASFLTTLPEYHKKSAMLDALCQAIESLWAKGKTKESRIYAQNAIDIIYKNADGYINNEPGYAQRMLQAANLAGKAINIGKTTAAHAMSYKLTDHFGIAHGHAVAMCLGPVWAHLIESNHPLEDLTEDDYRKFAKLYDSFNLNYMIKINTNTKIFDELILSINKQRLNNHPVKISEEQLKSMYEEILSLL